MASFRERLADWLAPRPPMSEERGLTFQSIWGADLEYTRGNTIAGVRVSTETALNASSVWACVRLLSNDIAGLPLDAFRATDQGNKALGLPGWLTRPSPNPNVTRGQHIQQLVSSLLLDGNAFVYFLPDVFEPVEVRVLDPATVDIVSTGSSVEYRVVGANRHLSPAEVVHIPLLVLPGQHRGLNPIDAARETIGLSIATDQYGASYFGNGATLSGVLEFPAGVEPTTDQLKELKASFTKKHVGARRSHAVGALTGGAKFNPMTGSNRDSQFIELRKYQVEEVARLFGIPPHMIASQEPGAVAYASVEQRSIDYVQHAVQPIVEKIEDSYARLLRGPRTYFKFNLEGLKRGDQKSRAEAFQIYLQNKVITREEVRDKEDFPYLGALGFLETPNNNAPEPAQEPTP